PTPNVGDVVHFTISVSNAGPDEATSATVQDLLPPSLAFVSATPSEGVYDATTGLWIVGTVDTSNAQTLTSPARVSGPANTINTAKIGPTQQFDPNPTNNQASATVTPQQADLAVAKMVSNATPNVGDIVTFTISLTNAGPDPATNVQVTDLL